MNKKANRLEIIRLSLFFILLLAGILSFTGKGAVQAHADTLNGFVKEDGKTFYYVNGQKVNGWVTIGKKKYYFYESTGMATGWQTDANGKRRFFSKKGVMKTGWKVDSTGRRYFAKKTGIMATGWTKIGGQRYYFIPNTGYAAEGLYKVGKYYRYFEEANGSLAHGWMEDEDGVRYFQTAAKTATDGAMATGFVTIGDSKYYFKKKTGRMLTGWQTISKKKYYFGTDGKMVTGTVTIDGKTYVFDENGVLQTSGASENTDNDESVSDGGLTFTTNGERTIKNYLLGAMIPIGKVLYVWGGGWNNSTTIGLTKTQTNWYKSQSSSYDYHSCNDLSVANRAKGFDCSGFVGWCAYQVMYNTSGQGGGYTVVSGEVGSTYKARGWGKTLNQNYLSNNNYLLKPGDIGYNSGHVWIVVGQCKDKSVVLVHSTPQAGVQLSGSTTPDGNYDSQAAALAKSYMQKYYASSLRKYEYHPSVGNYILQYGFFRWNRETLADPDKYMYMTADQILADLFAGK